MGSTDDRQPDLTSNPGVITATLLSGVIAVAVAAAEWVGSGRPLGSPAGILWSLVAVLGVAATVLGVGLELRRRRQAEQAERARPAVEAAGRPDRPRLPTGTVTFLFTDIEGSTRLLQDLGDRYGAVRDEHAAILRRAIRDGGGVEVSTEGDSFFAAFASPVGAVRAAVDAQRGLAGHGWPAGFPVRVRMGLHTGEGALGGDNYSGIDVNRAARVAAEAVRLLGRARLLTLTGAGGTGKSRLALHVAERLRPGYRDGAFFADLSTVTDPELVPSVLARALGVPEAPGRPILEALCDHLRDRQLLLVVDSFEQVAAAGPVIEELLAAAPEVRVLVTSRATLALRSEQELLVPPLDLPDPRRPPDLDALGRSEAVRLFVERARRSGRSSG
jgi:class 3 adenylate cyclase